jgi:hypothetical protein
MINITKKDIIDVSLLLILGYVAYTMITPQGQELVECKTYAPLINMTKTCAANNPEGNWTLICVSQEEAATRQQHDFNFTEKATLNYAELNYSYASPTPYIPIPIELNRIRKN